MEMIGKTEQFLRYYAADLTYNYLRDGVDSLNCATCGTPQFATDKEAKKYM